MRIVENSAQFPEKVNPIANESTILPTHIHLYAGKTGIH
jgi:hypothetical protein